MYHRFLVNDMHNLESLNYYRKNSMSVEIIKDDSLQKINFRVKNKVCLHYSRVISLRITFANTLFVYSSYIHYKGCGFKIKNSRLIKSYYYIEI